MNVLFAIALLAMGHPTKPDTALIDQSDEIRVLPVPRTPESNTVVLAVSTPEKGQTLVANPVWIQFRIDGYALGASSQFERADEVPISNLGQTIHVIIDNNPYIAVNEPAIDPFNEEGFYYDTSYKIELPYDLKEGMHTLRMFPARSFGESLKGENSFFAIPFYLGRKTYQADLDLNRPYLTYNEPSDQMPWTDQQPVFLDFCIRNCELTRDGYKVRLTIDQKISRLLTSWQPYYIYGLKRGKHSIRLELLDPKGALVPGIYNDVERSFFIQ